MGRHPNKIEVNQDRFLALRGGRYYYFRRIPVQLVDEVGKGKFVRISLKTNDLAKARAQRDVLETADNELWASMLSGGSKDAAAARYRAAHRRAAALGFSLRPLSDFHEAIPIDELLDRTYALAPRIEPGVVKALMGGIEKPSVKLSDAWDVFKSEIAPHQIARKSPAQKKKWLETKRAAVDIFIEVVGDLDVNVIEREHARKLFLHFQNLIAPKTGPAKASPSLGNRRLGDMRGLLREYFTHLGEPDRKNPFEKLSFKDSAGIKRKRPSIPLPWLTEKILAPGALAGLNEEARGILLVVADIGARPSEICNLTSSAIVLTGKVPHVRIEPRDDPNDPREIKTTSSIRIVPLVGLALAVFKRHPKGFPRYKDREAQLSAVINKYLRENQLLPSPQHSVYSLRHTFEDRMKDARIDEELRKILMGHSNDRPEYGEGGSLKLRQEEMLKIALPFSPSIV